MNSDHARPSSAPSSSADDLRESTERRRSTAPTSRTSFGESRPFDQLEGGIGREVLYRPQRYSVREISPVVVSLEISVGFNKVVCVVDNFSQNGLGAVWPTGAALPHEGTVYFGATVSFSGQSLYRGAVRVTNVRDTTTGVSVGLALTEDLIDIDAVMQLRDVVAWQHGAGESLPIGQRAWWQPGHETFKSIVSDLRLYLDQSRRDFDALEATLPWDVLHGTAENPARTRLIETVRAGFVADVVKLCDHADAVIRAVGPDETARLAEYSRAQLDEYFMPAPFFFRARTKPLGYAGDYEMMRFIYTDNFEGSTLYAKAMNLVGVSTAGGELVRTRRDAFKDWLLEKMSEIGPRGTLRLASIAAGPAQEIYELLSESTELPSKLEVVLFDQDDRALGFAFRRLTRLVSENNGRGVTVHYLHDTIRRLVTDPALFVEFGPFDVIFCGGLFDYLKQPVAARLTQAVYNNLVPGGAAVIGNVVPEMPSRWVMEHLLDWHLDYKSRHSLAQFAAEGAPDATFAFLEERSGWNPFIVVTKPSA